MKYSSLWGSVAASVVLALLCSSNCVYAQDSDEPGLETIWTTAPKILACRPSVLTKGSILSLRLGDDHGLELAIRRVSDNAWFFLVSKLPFDGMQPLMTSIQFAGASQVDIRMDQRGYDGPENPDGLIFTAPGEYDVYVSTALESEEGGFKCVVTYK